MNSKKQYERYHRQIVLKGFGIPAQQKLLDAKVLVAGAGGLGCPALQYLVAAGVGTVGIADNDIISLTNLHRQILYNMNDIGLPKAAVAAEKLNELNNEIKIIPYNLRLTNSNILNILSEYDILLDGTDNFSSRYMLNDACVLLAKPLVYGAVSRFEGQVAVFNVKNNSCKRSLNYRDLFPVPPKDDEVLNCAEAGVLGVLPGIVGTMQANETIKLITGIGEPLINKILTYNSLNNSTCEFNLSLSEQAQQRIPKNEDEFLNTDYEWLCSSQTTNDFEIDVSKFDALLQDNITVIDVREEGEQPLIDEFEHLKISLGELINNPAAVVTADNVVVFCQTGKRSLEVASLLNQVFHQSKKIYSLKGGIVEWKRQHAT